MFNAATREFCQQLKIKNPIIQAPMAGAIITPSLVYEVAQAGGLGSVPLGYLSLDDAQDMLQKTAQLTSNFAANIFIPASPVTPAPAHIHKMLLQLNQYRQKLNLEPLTTLPSCQEAPLAELIELIIASSVPILSFVFGILDEKHIHRLKQYNIYLIGTATTVAEGRILEKIGCDAIIAQGYEAGGHRGSFLNHANSGFIGTMALVPMLVAALKIPVIAAGGIMNGRGIAAAFMLGASAVQMGTAFLTCTESQASALHKQLILHKSAEDTYLTKVFTGKYVRCLKNQLVEDIESKFVSDEILPYPLQHYLTQELRSQAKKKDDFHYAGFWSGQATSLARALSVQALIKALEEETKVSVSRLKAGVKTV